MIIIIIDRAGPVLRKTEPDLAILRVKGKWNLGPGIIKSTANVSGPFFFSHVSVKFCQNVKGYKTVVSSLMC